MPTENGIGERLFHLSHTVRIQTPFESYIRNIIAVVNEEFQLAPPVLNGSILSKLTRFVPRRSQLFRDWSRRDKQRGTRHPYFGSQTQTPVLR
jgi:hypothetical protein